MDPLARQIDGVVRAERGRRALIGASIGAGVGAGIALAGWPMIGVAVGASGAALGALWPVDHRAAAVALDDAAGLDGALRCAYDHRDDDGPMSAAQRRRTLAALEAATADPGAKVRAVRPPSPTWLLGPLLWLGVALQPADSPDPTTEPVDDPASPALTASDDPRPETSPEEGGPAAAEREPRAEATPEPPEPEAGDAGPVTDGGSGGDPTGTAELGGVGVNAGDRAGPGPGRAEVDVARGGGPPMVLPVAAGDLPPSEGPAGRMVVGRTPPPPDAIADPARPYPRRYRRAIAAWFHREYRP